MVTPITNKMTTNIVRDFSDLLTCQVWLTNLLNSETTSVLQVATITFLSVGTWRAQVTYTVMV